MEAWCNKCSLLVTSYNGTRYYRHQDRCPNKGAVWVRDREDWVHFHDCPECGYPVEEGECCDCLINYCPDCGTIIENGESCNSCSTIYEDEDDVN